MAQDNVGMWMFHGHLSDHMSGGMMTDYEVLPSPTGHTEG